MASSPSRAKLIVSTPSDREIALRRSFDAPRALVWKAYTTPDLVKRWLGAFGDWSLEVCEMDLRPGGSYRWVWRKAGGGQMGVRGIFMEVVAPERIVSTEQFDDPWYEGEGQVTATFVEDRNKTTLTLKIRYISKAVRDSVLKSPMEHGVAASYDKLAEVVAALA
jgi:uncharacterized protein YndB with AHSA1/START domain